MQTFRTLSPSLALIAAIVGFASPSFAADGVYTPAGPEFRVNTYTTGDQGETGPFTIDGNDETFVVVWQSESQDGDQSGIFAQRFANDGASIGGEIAVNSYTTGRQFSPAVTMRSDGSFVVTWASDAPGETALYARRFDVSGSPQGGEFPVNAAGPAGVEEFHASIDSLADDGFIVVWEAIVEVSASYDVFGRRFDATGSPLGDEFRVNLNDAAAQRHPSVSSSVSGAFVVAWSSENADGDGSGIVARRFAGDGVPAAGDFPVNTTTAGGQDEPDVKVHDDGTFVVVWTSSDGHDGDASGVFGQQFDAAGSTVDSEFQVNTRTTGSQHHAAVDGDETGSYVVTWEDDGEDGNGASIQGQAFYNLGGKFLDQFRINTYTAGEQAHPGIASSPYQDYEFAFVVAWSSEGQFDGSDVVAQRYALVGTSTTSGSLAESTTTYTTNTTTTTLLTTPSCAQPISDGPEPVASDCLFILNVAVGLGSCSPECICAPNGPLPISAVDAQVCLAVAVGTPGPALNCPC